MKYKELAQLHLAQCETFLNKSKNNSYSDNHKQVYQDTLFKLFNAIKPNSENLDGRAIKNFQRQLSFITRSLEFLLDSTLNSIPFEVVSCLDIVMKEWIKNEEFIIVTSLDNDMDEYCFDPTLATDDSIYQLILAETGVEFPRRLVQISMPLVLARDYFSSVTLYHELGHFIDEYYLISSDLSEAIIDYSAFQKQEIELYFPYTVKQDGPGRKDSLQKLKNHLGEYFCDLFAAQYVGNTSVYYLAYQEISSSKVTDYTHPSSENRNHLVEDFLEGKPNPLLKLIKKFIKEYTKNDLAKRFEKISGDDFYKFIPLDVQNEQQLHGVFPYAWDIWLKGTANFLNVADLKMPLLPESIYKLLNNLMEKSIGNYFIQKDWQKTEIK